MPYLISALSAAASMAVLLTVLVRLRGPVGRLSDHLRSSHAHLTHCAGTLAARFAALRSALNQRRHRSRDGSQPTPAA